MSLNVLVLSSAGKPIFSRYDDGSSVTTAGLVQAMSSFAEDSGSPIRRIVTSAGNEATFMKRGALYLLAIYTNPSGPANSSRQESVASSPIYIECILEYVYSQIVFTLTSKVQAIFRKSGGYDLRGMLGDNHDVILKGLLDKGETTGNFMTASFTPLPLPPLQRNQCTHVLQSLGDHVPNTLFSVLMSKQNAEMKVVTLVQVRPHTHLHTPFSKRCEPRRRFERVAWLRARCLRASCGEWPAQSGPCSPLPLPEAREAQGEALCSHRPAPYSQCVSCAHTVFVQPSNVAHQIDGPDLALLTNFVTQQSTTLRSSESWFPVCLPRFNPTGFIYCYTCCLHDPTELFIMLLSTENSPEQFHMFQNARAAVVSALGLKGRTAGKIIHQHSFEDSRESSMNPNGNQPERASPTMQLQGVGGGGEAAGAEEEGAEEEGEQSAYPVPASVGFAPAENSDPAFRLPRRSSAIEASARGTSDAVAMSAEEEENNVKRSVPLIECILSSSRLVRWQERRVDWRVCACVCVRLCVRVCMAAPLFTHMCGSRGDAYVRGGAKIHTDVWLANWYDCVYVWRRPYSHTRLAVFTRLLFAACPPSYPAPSATSRGVWWTSTVAPRALYTFCTAPTPTSGVPRAYARRS